MSEQEKTIKQMAAESKEDPKNYPDLPIVITQDDYEAIACAIVTFTMMEPVPGMEQQHVDLSNTLLGFLEKCSAKRKEILGHDS
jgi:hypothetical protein